MAKFTYFSLALAGSNLFLPEPARQVDFASLTPSACSFPRLFKNKSVAEVAKGAWERRNPGKELEIIPMTLEPSC